MLSIITINLVDYNGTVRFQLIVTANRSEPRQREAPMTSQETGAALRFHWFLPTNGDGRDIVGGNHSASAGAVAAARPPTIGYLGQVARAAEQLGFEGALTPTGSWCEDAWLTTAMLAGVTERLKFLVAFRPGFISPTLAAQQAATFQRLSAGRLLLNVVTGGESPSSAPTATSSTRRGATSGRASSSTSSPGCGAARPSPSRATTCESRAPGSPGSPSRSPASTSAARRTPRDRSPPGTPTSTSPGASRRTRWTPSSAGSRHSRRRRTARRRGSASGCTSSPGTPPRRPGASRTG